jgi:hypothetical protein
VRIPFDTVCSYIMDALDVPLICGSVPEDAEDELGIYINIYICIYIHMYIYIYIYIYMFVSYMLIIYIFVLIFMFICICMYTNIYAYLDVPLICGSVPEDAEDELGIYARMHI